MTRDVLVSVSGIHAVDGESGDVSVVTSGVYYKKNGKHYIIYDEYQEDAERPLRCTIKLSDRKAEILRGGDVRAHMEFEPGKTTVNCYSTPFGEIILTISTFDMQILEEEDLLRAEILYSLEMNSVKTSDSRVVIEARSKKGREGQDS